MKKFKDWLVKDWWLKLISLLLSFIIWFVWIQIENPSIPKDFMNVRVSFVNEDAFDSDNKVFAVLDKSDIVKVTVTAPKSVINNISVSDIVAEADFSKMVDGVIPISFGLANSTNYDSVIGNHDTVQLSIEDRARKYVSLVTYTEGEVAENHLYNGVTLDQNMIEISGPRSAVDTVSYAGVSINIDGASESISANMEISLYDSTNKVVNNSAITKQSDAVHVAVEILETKDVIVYAAKTGIPADGYVYTGNLDVTPAMVKLAGKPRDLSGVSRIMISEPVDITDATSDVSREYDLAQYLPSGVMFADSEFDGLATVTIHVESTSGKSVSINPESIKIVNAPADANISVAPVAQNIKITVEGLQSDLDSFTEDNVVATIDVGAWMIENDMTTLSKGSYSMPVTIETSGSITATQNIAVKVNVQ